MSNDVATHGTKRADTYDLSGAFQFEARGVGCKPVKIESKVCKRNARDAQTRHLKKSSPGYIHSILPHAMISQ